VQAYGGARYSPWLAMPRRLRPPHSDRRDEVERDMAYVVGASLLASRAFLESVGLMCEDYFLFFEELDWALRAKGHFRLAWAPGSLVYHKEGRSTGLSPRHYNAAAERRLHWSQLRLTRQHLPRFLPLVVLRHLLVFLKSVGTLQLDRAGAVLRLYRDLARHGGAWPPG
jgi:GT2 family glycosyltransferase